MYSGQWWPRGPGAMNFDISSLCYNFLFIINRLIKFIKKKMQQKKTNEKKKTKKKTCF